MLVRGQEMGIASTAVRFRPRRTPTEEFDTEAEGERRNQQVGEETNGHDVRQSDGLTDSLRWFPHAFGFVAQI